jgi:hypothetical protein
MKKLLFVLSILIIASMILTACGNPPAPVTEVPAVPATAVPADTAADRDRGTPEARRSAAPH